MKNKKNILLVLALLILLGVVGFLLVYKIPSFYNGEASKKIHTSIDKDIIFASQFAFTDYSNSANPDASTYDFFNIVRYDVETDSFSEVFQDRKKFSKIKHQEGHDFDYFSKENKFVVEKDENSYVIVRYKDLTGEDASVKTVNFFRADFGRLHKMLWSKDGKKIIFGGRNVFGGSSAGSINVANEDGTDLKVIVKEDANLIDIFPDGDILVVKQRDSFYTELYKVNVETLQEELLVSAYDEEKSARNLGQVQVFSSDNCFISGDGQGLLCQGTSLAKKSTNVNFLVGLKAKSFDMRPFSSPNGPIYYYNFNTDTQYIVNAEEYWYMALLHALPWHDGSNNFITASFYNPNSDYHDLFNLFIMNKKGKTKNMLSSESDLLNSLTSNHNLKMFWLEDLSSLSIDMPIKNNSDSDEAQDILPQNVDDSNSDEIIVCGESFHLEDGSCTSDTRYCFAGHGRGLESWDGDQWGFCKLIECEPGYILDDFKCLDAENIECTDSDGLDYSVRGTVSYYWAEGERVVHVKENCFVKGGNGSSSDYGDMLSELYCKNGKPASEHVECDCQLGACVE